MIYIVLWMLLTLNLHEIKPNFGVESVSPRSFNRLRNDSTNYDVDSYESIEPTEDTASIETVFSGTRRKKRQAHADHFTLTKTTPREHPYAVLLLKCNHDNKWCGERCSGTLITLQWVLTSRVLVESLVKEHIIKIYAGGYKESEVNRTLALGSQVQVSTTFHYSDETRLGLVKADRPFYESGSVKAISLVAIEWPFREKELRKCTITGFSLTYTPSGRHWLDPEPEVPEWNPMRQTIRGLVGLACRCRSREEAHEGNGTRYICSFVETYSGWPSKDDYQCPVPIGAGLVCDGQLTGVLDRVVTVSNGECSFEDRLKDNCNIEDQTYNGLSQHFFLETYYQLGWINEFTNILNHIPENSSTYDMSTEDESKGASFKSVPCSLPITILYLLSSTFTY